MNSATPQYRTLEFDALAGLAAGRGLTVMAAADLSPLPKRALIEWQERGYAGEMKYMLRPAELLTDPRRSAEWARSVVVFAVFYEQTRHPVRLSGYGRVARYAWGRDYHAVLGAKLSELASDLARVGVRAESFTDAVPLTERALALRAGLGFQGRNSMVILPGLGSYFFLAELFIDRELSGADSLSRASGTCGSCRRCTSACPTGALVADGVVDGRRCISYLTIEKRGMLSLEERRAIGEWVFGCDLCQDCCPFNHAPLQRGREPWVGELERSAGAGPLLALDTVLGIRDSRSFDAMFGATPLTRTRRAGLLRNAAVVCANTGAEQCVPALRDAAGRDNSPVVRAHALWALEELARKSGSRALTAARTEADRALSDPDTRVRGEALRIVDC